MIPVKRSVGSKQRLSSQLPDGVRRLVSRALASRMVRCAAQGWPPSQVVVVGDEPEVTDLCHRLGLNTLGDGGGGQSDAVRTGQSWCLERGATTLATVAADLPLVETEDLARLWESAVRLPEQSLCLIPDRSGTGSNGLILRPAHLDPFLFGPDSRRRHGAAAERLGLSFSVLELPHLGWDIDRPEDLESPAGLQGSGAHPVVAWAREIAELERAELAPELQRRG